MTETSKPMWKRCDGCKARIFNEAVDIAAHRANCPADLKRAIQKLANIVEKLTERTEALEDQIDDAGDLLAIDPNSVDEDGFATLDAPDDADEPYRSTDFPPQPTAAEEAEDDDLETLPAAVTTIGSIA